jgi:hypothetical protein
MKFKNFEISDATTLRAIIANDGYALEDTYHAGERLEIKDAITSEMLGPLLPQAVVEMVIEATEPLQSLTPLMDTIQWNLGDTVFNTLAMGVIDVNKVPENSAYPEKTLQFGGGTVTASIDKYGVALSFTEEAISRSRWDIVSMHTREVGRAFTRRKEYVIQDHIRNLGDTIFDNKNPTASHLGVTHGRDALLAANGSLTMDDLVESYSFMLTKGYTPNLLIMHPLSWMMWMRDPNFRAFAFQAGGGRLYQPYNGSAMNKMNLTAGMELTLASGNRNALLGTSNLQTAGALNQNFNPQLQSSPQVPSYFPWPMDILVSPYVPYDPATKLTDIYLCDRSRLGAIVQQESITSDEYGDMKYDIRYMRFKERYGMYIYEEGLGINVMKNISVEPNYYSMEPARGSYDLSDLVAIPANTPVV